MPTSAREQRNQLITLLTPEEAATSLERFVTAIRELNEEQTEAVFGTIIAYQERSDVTLLTELALKFSETENFIYLQAINQLLELVEPTTRAGSSLQFGRALLVLTKYLAEHPDSEESGSKESEDDEEDSVTTVTPLSICKKLIAKKALREYWSESSSEGHSFTPLFYIIQSRQRVLFNAFLAEKEINQVERVFGGGLLFAARAFYLAHRAGKATTFYSDCIYQLLDKKPLLSARYSTPTGSCDTWDYLLLSNADDLIRQYLRSGADPNKSGRRGASPVLKAVCDPRVKPDVVQVLINSEKIVWTKELFTLLLTHYNHFSLRELSIIGEPLLGETRDLFAEKVARLLNSSPVYSKDCQALSEALALPISSEQRDLLWLDQQESSAELPFLLQVSKKFPQMTEGSDGLTTALSKRVETASYASIERFLKKFEEWVVPFDAYEAAEISNRSDLLALYHQQFFSFYRELLEEIDHVKTQEIARKLACNESLEDKESGFLRAHIERANPLLVKRAVAEINREADEYLQNDEKLKCYSKALFKYKLNIFVTAIVKQKIKELFKKVAPIHLLSIRHDSINFEDFNIRVSNIYIAHWFLLSNNWDLFSLWLELISLPRSTHSPVNAFLYYAMFPCVTLETFKSLLRMKGLNFDYPINGHVALTWLATMDSSPLSVEKARLLLDAYHKEDLMRVLSVATSKAQEFRRSDLVQLYQQVFLKRYEKTLRLACQESDILAMKKKLSKGSKLNESEDHWVLESIRNANPDSFNERSIRDDDDSTKLLKFAKARFEYRHNICIVDRLGERIKDLLEKIERIEEDYYSTYDLNQKTKDYYLYAAHFLILMNDWELFNECLKKSSHFHDVKSTGVNLQSKLGSAAVTPLYLALTQSTVTVKTLNSLLEAPGLDLNQRVDGKHPLVHLFEVFPKEHAEISKSLEKATIMIKKLPRVILLEIVDEVCRAASVNASSCESIINQLVPLKKLKEIEDKMHAYLPTLIDSRTHSAKAREIIGAIEGGRVLQEVVAMFPPREQIKPDGAFWRNFGEYYNPPLGEPDRSAWNLAELTAQGKATAEGTFSRGFWGTPQKKPEDKIVPISAPGAAGGGGAGLSS